MNIRHLAAASTAIALVACSEAPAPEESDAASAEPVASANPFSEDWDTPFGVPPFDLIESEHYLPAIRAGMEEQENAEIEAITAND